MAVHTFLGPRHIVILYALKHLLVPLVSLKNAAGLEGHRPRTAALLGTLRTGTAL